MRSGELDENQKNMVWRYAHCAGIWRRKYARNFANLASELAAGRGIVADGIAVDASSCHPVVLGDAKDPEFFAAIFKNDNGAVPEMRSLDLERLRRYVINGEGELPMPPARLAAI
ncbi:MAG: hypothetical protein JO166_18310 [Deltaproteobacteria bacterium]|nr:hypothetical protein [Deltaproteobacteria bacterium]